MFVQKLRVNNYIQVTFYISEFQFPTFHILMQNFENGDTILLTFSTNIISNA